MAPLSSKRRVKKACVSSSAIPSRWSTQPSRVTFMLKVRSPMARGPIPGTPNPLRRLAALHPGGNGEIVPLRSDGVAGRDGDPQLVDAEDVGRQPQRFA